MKLKAALPLLFALFSACSSAERPKLDTPDYGRYELKIQVFNGQPSFFYDSITCNDIINGPSVELTWVDNTDIGGRKYYQGTLTVSTSSVVQCGTETTLLFLTEEYAPGKVQVISFVPYDYWGMGEKYHIRVTPSHYLPDEYASVFDGGNDAN